MFEKIEHCPICDHTALDNQIICKDHFLSGESFAITRCTNCSFLFTNPRPSESNLGKYYKSEAYISHTNKATNLVNFAYKIARHYTLEKKVKLISFITPEKNLLDFGCGSGEFLRACQKKAWKIHGFEPDPQARGKAASITQIKIFSDLRDLKHIDKVSLITLWHVLEHVPNLNETIEQLKSKLAKNGKFLIAVPNHKSYDAQYYKEYWAAYDVPRHLYHFSTKTMKGFLHKHGLKLHKIIPMTLDAYYVSLLSEKYKTGTNNYLKSIVTGYKSNSYAIKNDKNYSSLIYIAGKR